MIYFYRYAVLVTLMFFAGHSALQANEVDEALARFDDPETQVQSAADAQTNEASMGFDNAPNSAQSASEDILSGFDEEGGNDTSKLSQTKNENDTVSNLQTAQEGLFRALGVSGELKQQIAYALNSHKPRRDDISSLPTTFFLDYEHTFTNNYKLKLNGRYFYDWAYDIKRIGFTSQEKRELRSEAMLFDAYLQGSLSNSLDFKIGRQVVVWGRSDTIRITDVLNPLDNRRPGMADIEDLRLPVTMAKLDYYTGKWRITPIVILEQRFTLDTPFGSPFYPLEFPLQYEKSYHDATYALSIGGEFHSFDVNFYAAHIYDDNNFIEKPFTLQAHVTHHKINMLGTAFNLLSGSWLFKSEWAYLDKLRYTIAPDKALSRIDALIGLEYNGISDTMISFDTSLRHFTRYDTRLGLKSVTIGTKQIAIIPTKRDTYQYALRANSDFFNNTLHANALVTLFGNKGDEGGFWRMWATYDYDDSVKFEAGVLDFIGGEDVWDVLKQERIVYVNAIYSF